LEAALPYVGDKDNFNEKEKGKEKEYVKDNERQALTDLIEFLKSGDEDAFRRHSVAWLQVNPTVDYVLGFIENLKDPRGIIGNWEGAVWFPADSTLVEKLADSALYFERRMPWPDRYKRKKVEPPVARLANAIIGTGDMGPVPWAGFNLPNYADIRAEYGSKNVIFMNIMESESTKERKRIINEFYLPQYRTAAKKWGKLIREVEVYMHEVIGHGSGKPNPALQGDPREHLGRVYSALEECRADLVALHFAGDPILSRWGVLSERELDEFAKASLVEYLQRGLIEHAKFRDGVVKEAHRLGRHLILRYLVMGGKDGKADYGVEVVRNDRGYFVEVNDIKKARTGVARLLGLLQTYKATGDHRAAAALFDQLGRKYDPDWQADMEMRTRKLRMAGQKAFVFPRLELVKKEGKVVDVRLFNDETFSEQQLRFSRMSECCACGRQPQSTTE